MGKHQEKTIKQVLEELSRKRGTYTTWKNRIGTLKAKYKGNPGVDDLILYCRRRQYLKSNDLAESFYFFCKDIIGYKDLDPKSHGKMCDLILHGGRYIMLQACRGTFKSSLTCAAYPTWEVGRDWFWNNYECNTRILLASEVLKLAERNLKWCNQLMTWNKKYMEICGEHKGERGWKWDSLLSKHRSDSTIAEATIATMAIDADRVGFHHEIIICDDIEAERNSATKDQIERVWDFFRLLFSIIHQRKGDPYSGRIILVGTRWHYDDIYARIEANNYNEPDETKFQIVKLPDRDPETQELNFPKILDEKELENKRRKQGPYIYSCQYKLDPVPEEDRVFKSQWVQTADPEMYLQRLSIYVGADFAYSATSRRIMGLGNSDPDYTVVITVGVDKDWNYIVMDHFRERCTKGEAIKEMFRQYYQHRAICCALQKYDRSQVADIIEQESYRIREETGENFPMVEWVTYPSKQSKQDRIETTLQPLFSNKKVFITKTMNWFLADELLDFPRAKHDDACDALCNIVKVAKPARKRKPRKPKVSQMWKEIKRLMAGKEEDSELNWKKM